LRARFGPWMALDAQEGFQALHTGREGPARAHGQGDNPWRSLSDYNGCGQRLLGFVRRYDGVCINSCGRHLDGHHAQQVDERQHPREQRRKDNGRGGRGLGGRCNFHYTGIAHTLQDDRRPGRLADDVDIQHGPVPNDNGRRDDRRYPGCAFYHPAQADANCGP
jgi:hypothetical protein